MKKILPILSLLSLFLYAESVEITSKVFEADEKKMVSVFSGGVHIKKDRDKIDAKKVIVYFGKDKKPKKYEAIGDVKFFIVLDSNKTYEGKAQRIVYKPKTSEYIFEKDVFILQKPEMRKIYGEKIVINRFTGRAKVEGSKDKPVKFIFKIEDNSDKKAKK